MGTSVHLAIFHKRDWDHPHAYGDKYKVPVWRIIHRGSSPRVWGQADILYLCTADGRIIPTRMGTSVNQVSAYDSNEDHPHAYGDKMTDKEYKEAIKGSSPRVWGQVTRYLHMLKDSRIIPTRMGTRKHFINFVI